MNVNTLNLAVLKRPLEDALSAYKQSIGMEFKDFPDLTLTPEKPNSARTIIPITYENVKIGDLYVIVFAKGDGTGDAKTYTLDDLIIPKEFQHTEKPERIIPRAKTGITYEALIPLFSMTQKGYAAMFAVSLDELGIVDKTITPLWKLGQSDSDYSKVLHGEVSADPQIYFTVGESPDGKRVGDPHAIYYNPHTEIEDALQVVGFLGIGDKNNPLINKIRAKLTPQKN